MQWWGCACSVDRTISSPIAVLGVGSASATSPWWKSITTFDPKSLRDRLGIAWKSWEIPWDFQHPIPSALKRHVEVSRSQVLSESASSFRRDAEQLRRLVWWGNVKKVLIMGLIVVPETAWLWNVALLRCCLPEGSVFKRNIVSWDWQCHLPKKRCFKDYLFSCFLSLSLCTYVHADRYMILLAITSLRMTWALAVFLEQNGDVWRLKSSGDLGSSMPHPNSMVDWLDIAGSYPAVVWIRDIPWSAEWSWVLSGASDPGDRYGLLRHHLFQMSLSCWVAERHRERHSSSFQRSWRKTPILDWDGECEHEWMIDR